MFFFQGCLNGGVNLFVFLLDLIVIAVDVLVRGVVVGVVDAVDALVRPAVGAPVARLAPGRVVDHVRTACGQHNS